MDLVKSAVANRNRKEAALRFVLTSVFRLLQGLSISGDLVVGLSVLISGIIAFVLITMDRSIGHDLR